jgi:hypothetical protein
VTTAGLDSPLDGRFADAASPALILPEITHIGPIELNGFSPDGQMVVKVPPDQPRIVVRHRGRTTELKVLPHRILISLLEMGVSIVWHAAWHPPTDFFDIPPGSGDAMEMLLRRVEVLADNQKLAPLGISG